MSTDTEEDRRSQQISGRRAAQAKRKKPAKALHWLPGKQKEWQKQGELGGEETTARPREARSHYRDLEDDSD